MTWWILLLHKLKNKVNFNHLKVTEVSVNRYTAKYLPLQLEYNEWYFICNEYLWLSDKNRSKVLWVLFWTCSVPSLMTDNWKQRPGLSKWWVTDKQINANTWSGDTERSGVTGISYCATVKRQTSKVHYPLNSCSPSLKSILASSGYNLEIICMSLYTWCESEATYPK